MVKTVDEHLHNTGAHGASTAASNRNKSAVARKVSSRCNLSYFKKVIKSLDGHREDVIRYYGFLLLLQFDGASVPRVFVQWIADQVDLNCSDIVVRGKSIPLNPLAVHKVTGLPLGGRVIETDEVEKLEFLRLINSATIPKIKSLGDKIISKQPMPDEEFFRFFMVVALSTFLVPNSSTVASPKYFAPLIDLTTVSQWDWSKLLVDKLLDFITKYKLKKRRTLGGCIYFLAEYYLDFLHFGSHVAAIPRSIPRINVWKEKKIRIYSLYDKISDNVYGKRPVKSIEETCYVPLSAEEQYQSFKQSLSSRFGYLPNEVIEHLSSNFKTFSENGFVAPDYSPDQLVLSMFQYMHESSASVPEQPNLDDGTSVAAAYHVNFDDHRAASVPEQPNSDDGAGAAAAYRDNFDDHSGASPSANGIAEGCYANDEIYDSPAHGNDTQLPVNDVVGNEVNPEEGLTQRVESDGNNAMSSQQNISSQPTVVVPSENSGFKCVFLSWTGSKCMMGSNFFSLFLLYGTFRGISVTSGRQRRQFLTTLKRLSVFFYLGRAGRSFLYGLSTSWAFFDQPLP